MRFCVLLAAFGRPAAVLPAASLRSPRHGRFIAEAFSCTATIEMALRFSCQADLSAIRETLALNKDTAVTNAASFIQRREAAAASLPVINVELDASVPAPTSLVAAQMSAVNSATSLDGFVSTAMAALAKLKVYWRRLASLRHASAPCSSLFVRRRLPTDSFLSGACQRQAVLAKRCDDALRDARLIPFWAEAFAAIAALLRVSVPALCVCPAFFARCM